MVARTILVIDDRPDPVESLNALLTEQGYRVVIARDADSGVEKIRSERPEILILGLAQPDMFAMLQRLRADPQCSHLPVIAMLRAWAQDVDILKGWELGIDAYQSALYNPLELASIVRRIFRSIDEDTASAVD